jgi:hypothetical protein
MIAERGKSPVYGESIECVYGFKKLKIHVLYMPLRHARLGLEMSFQEEEN